MAVIDISSLSALKLSMLVSRRFSDCGRLLELAQLKVTLVMTSSDTLTM